MISHRDFRHKYMTLCIDTLWNGMIRVDDEGAKVRKEIKIIARSRWRLDFKGFAHPVFSSFRGPWPLNGFNHLNVSAFK